MVSPEIWDPKGLWGPREKKASLVKKGFAVRRDTEDKSVYPVSGDPQEIL